MLVRIGYEPKHTPRGPKGRRRSIKNARILTWKWFIKNHRYEYLISKKIPYAGKYECDF